MDYNLNADFEFSYFYRQITDKKERENLLDDLDANPYKRFYFDIIDEKGFSLDNSYEVRDYYNLSNIIERNTSFLRRANNLTIVVTKKCENENCTFNKINKELKLHMFFENKVIDHYNEGDPVHWEKNDYYYKLDLENTFEYFGFWGVYIYLEKKGLEKIFSLFSGDPFNFTLGYIEDYYSNQIRGGGVITIDKEDYRPLLGFRLCNNLEGIKMYTRKKKSFFDYLANIAALSSTIFNIMVKVFSMIYSRIFDNYKIVEKILSKGIKGKIETEIELSDNIQYKNNITNSDLENNLINNQNKEESNDIQNLVTNENEENADVKIEYNDEPVKLPKLRFFDFFLNNVYSSKICDSLRKQKLISTCDEILYNYYSIDNILLNQILFENLLKDYKWNNPRLKSIHRNELVIKLKKYL